MKHSLVLLLPLLLAGCLSSDNVDSGNDGVFHADGQSRYASALTVCDGTSGCSSVLTQKDWATFTAGSEVRNPTFRAEWTSDVTDPPELFIWVVLDHGGTWGMAQGPSPLTFELVDLIPGTYEVRVDPPFNVTYTGPIDIMVDWSVDGS